MLQLHNLLVSKWRQWRRKPSGKNLMLTLYYALTGIKITKTYWKGEVPVEYF